MNKESSGYRQPLLKLWPGRRWFASIAAVLVISIIAAACSQASDNAEPSSDGDSGSAIVAYQGQDVLGGQEIDFNDLLRRGRPVVLNFWAGLCPPCRQEMPDFQRLYDQKKDDFILVGVDVGPFVRLGSHDDARQFLREFNITYPTAFAKKADLLRQYNVLGMPTTVFFTPDGKVFRKHTGFMTGSQMRQNLEDLLDASSRINQSS